jgi:branched-chain amino acid transport system ATP-binding protein
VGGPLAVDGLRVRYGRTVAITDITVTVHPGEVIAVIGPNGAGKSTLLRAISGLVPIDAGTISYGDHRIDGMPSHRIVELGVIHVPEGRHLFPAMTTGENLEMGAYPARSRSLRSRSVDMVYDHFPRLRERTRQVAGSMSGGEQQMLAMGRALMSKPDVLLLDEPTVGLAPKMVQELASAITDLARAFGCAVLLVEQNVPLALRLASRAYVLELGRVVAAGSSDELRADARVSAAYLAGTR